MNNTSNYQKHYYPCYHYHQNQQEHGVLEDGRKNLRPYQKDSLFKKPLTPSDVGKLNRLVIPKHHAERHFPLDINSVEKGLLLSFEDEAGKPWRFRYLYWSSSQSYVFTKGWSRFVKEKRLVTGDIVFFERGRSNGDRLYIGWKRRGEVTPAAVVGDVDRSHDASGKPVGFGSCPQVYNCHFTSPSDGSMQQEEEHHCHVKEGTTMCKNPKKLRLFGVNLEYGVDPSKSSDPITIHGGSGELVSSIVDQTELHLPCNGFSSTSY